MSNVVAFPGVILAERETGSAPPARPLVTSKPCPVCTAPIRSDDCEVIGCTRCRVEFHAPCFWRVLPISEWVVFSDVGLRIPARGLGQARVHLRRVPARRRCVMATRARPPEPWYVTISDSAADKFAAMNFENALLNCRDEYVRLSVAQRAVFSRDIRSLVDLFERERRAGEEPTTTPDDTLREAGISSERQAQYQRRMSSLLGRGGA